LSESLSGMAEPLFPTLRARVNTGTSPENPYSHVASRCTLNFPAAMAHIL